MLILEGLECSAMHKEEQHFGSDVGLPLLYPQYACRPMHKSFSPGIYMTY